MRIVIITVVSALLLTSSCVSKKQYIDELKAHQNWEDQANALAKELKEAKAELSKTRQFAAQVDFQTDKFQRDSLRLTNQYLTVKKELDRVYNDCQEEISVLDSLQEVCNADLVLAKKHMQQSRVYVANNSKPTVDLSPVISSLAVQFDRFADRDLHYTLNNDQIIVSLPDQLLFKSGSYKVSTGGGGVLDLFSRVLKNHPEVEILVIGHTDSKPIRRENIRDNWDLSVLRASSIVRILKRDFDIEPTRMMAGGKGQFDSIASNETEEEKSKNRRTDIILYSKGTNILSYKP